MPANIKPLKMCINITIPSVEDTDLSLYEAMCTLASKLQDTINEINDILAEVVVSVNGHQGPEVLLTGDDISVSNTDDQSISGVLSQKYSADNPPPYPVTSVNGQTGVLSVSQLITTKGRFVYRDEIAFPGFNVFDQSGFVGSIRFNKYENNNDFYRLEEVNNNQTKTAIIYTSEDQPPYPVTSVNNKTGAVTLSAGDISTAGGTVQQDLITKLAFTGQQYTSWDSVRNQPCGVYRTSGFLPWSTSTTDNGLLYIVGDNSSGSAYIFFRDSIPNSLYFAVGPGTSADDWFFVNGSPISG